MSHTLTATKNVLTVTFVLGAMFMQAGVASAQTPQHQLAEVKAQLEQLSAQLNTPAKQVLGEATTQTVSELPVRPVCSIKTDKRSYKLGESIIVTWDTTGAKDAEFVVGGEEDNLTYPAGSIGVKGKKELKAAVLGLPTITIKATSKTGHSVNCFKTISVVDEAAGAKDARISALNAQLLQLSTRINKIQESIMKLTLNELLLKVKADQISEKIEELEGDVPSAPVMSAEFVDAEAEAGSGNEAITFRIGFEVTAANDGDLYLNSMVSHNSKLNTGAAGFFYRIMDTNGKTYSSSGAVQTSADEDGEYYVVGEGETEDFNLTQSFTPEVAGSYYMEITALQWSSEAGGETTKTKLDRKVYRTPAANFAPKA